MCWRRPSSSAPIKKAIADRARADHHPLTVASDLASSAGMAGHKVTRNIRMAVCAGVAGAIVLAAASPALAAACASPANFPGWLQGFKQEAVAQGISPQTISGARRAHLRSRHHRQGPRPGRVRAELPAILRPHGVQQPLQVGAALLKRNAGTFRQHPAEISACRVRCWSPSGDWRPISAR